MRFQFSFKHMKASPALQQYAETKIRSQIDKFVTKPIEAHVTFAVDRHLHIATCVLSGGDGFSLQVEHACEDMYGSVDRMIDKMAVQLKRKKDKLKGHKFKRPERGFGEGEETAEYASVEVDASDILKFEQARRRATGT